MVSKRNVKQPKADRRGNDKSLPSLVSRSSDMVDGTVLSSSEAWTPTLQTSFKLLMSARLCAALWNGISDCDETFNYWEPAHFLLRGHGFQTWEYSPLYAIRSYAYILLHVLPMKFLSLMMSDNKVLLFFLTRCILGLVCALSELVFYRGVCKTFGPGTGRLTLVMMTFAPGLFVSSCAFLPSSFSMYMTFLGAGLWLLDKAQLSVVAFAASAIVGWPFAAVLGIPVALDLMFIKRKVSHFLMWCAVSLLILFVPTIAIDSHYYGRLVMAPINIVIYNVFSGRGPELYGTEPPSFYFINGFLNFNVAFLLALAALPCVVLSSWVWRQRSNQVQKSLLCLVPLYIWILIFFTRPHKEERFLFPVYPFLVLAAAFVIIHTQRLLQALMTTRTASQKSSPPSWPSAIFAITFVFLSLSRILAIYQGYHAPMDVYVELNRLASDPEAHTLPVDQEVNVCTGKEWYRFGSSFFLPGDKWNLRFLKSEFQGQLPKPYSSEPDATRLMPSHMNDLNREEPSRYTDVKQCHYLIDRDADNWSKLEPKYSDSPDWTVVKAVPFLDASRSHRLLRAFYIPFLSGHHTVYTDYVLLRRTRRKPASRERQHTK